jgi:hypothetical protein
MLTSLHCSHKQKAVSHPIVGRRTTNLPSGALVTSALLTVNSPSRLGSLPLTVVAMALVLIRWSRLAVSGNELPFGTVFGKSVRPGHCGRRP